MLIWIDLETTGLNPNEDKILEVSVAITDDNLQEIKTFTQVAYYSETPPMNDFVRNMHSVNGLIEALPFGEPLQEISDRAIAFLEFYDIKANTVPMCGSTVGFDRAFLKKHLPTLEAFFHYRSVDVSSIKELVRRWYPNLGVPSIQPNKEHRGLPDILDSIAELSFYKENVFSPQK